jgi:hypothetical protein
LSLLDIVNNSWKTSAFVDITPVESLQFLLCINSIWCESALACIESIQTGHIVGRAAVYCVSEIRLVVNKVSQPCFWDLQSWDTTLSLKKVVAQIQEIGSKCIEPLYGGEESDVQLFSVCLELLPAVIGALDGLKVYGDSNLGDADTENILDSMFYVEWDLSLLLPISSILCELYAYMNKRHLVEFKVLIYWLFFTFLSDEVFRAMV